MSGFTYSEVTLSVVLPATILACWIDYSARKVPNWLNGSLAILGLAAQAMFFGWSGVGASLGGMAVGLVVLIVPWAMHGMGAGDVKLMAAIGAWIGPMNCFIAFALGAIIGGVISVILITVGRKWGHAVANMGVIMTKVSRADTAFSEFGSARGFGATSTLLPYGIPLSMGAWLVLLGHQLGWRLL